MPKWRRKEDKDQQTLLPVEWQSVIVFGALRQSVRLRPPSVQTTCSLSYWCTVVCTLVRLGREALLFYLGKHWLPRRMCAVSETANCTKKEREGGGVRERERLSECV
uniref:Uncharacterized protein n=1 Tax=Hucho hucho TaxID=62062 RepID=A0A4W5PF38_9TELE